MNKTATNKNSKNNKSKNKSTTKVANESTNQKISNSDEQLHAIRDLLFGEQLARLEQMILQQNTMLNERLDDLKQLISDKGEEFDDKLEEAHREIEEHLKSNYLEHVNSESDLDNKLATLDKQLIEFQNMTEKDFNQAHQTLTDTANKINASINQEVKQLNKNIESTSRDLSAKKADRKAIANLLESMASNLTQSQA